MMILRAVEVLAVAFCGNDCSLLGITWYPGTTTHVDIPFRDILVEAVTMNAQGIVIAHNHPSGIALPSEDDLAATRRLVRACEAMGVTLLDHLVFAGETCFSFRQKGLI
jgi:DNA repair protein RadC